ncbi:MAG TPA: hypothetical protein VG604_01600 [Candidatus Saccharimonadales bacterium]|nr:hypothetical protein [Candidatus Saccharimonadales bacterium]
MAEETDNKPATESTPTPAESGANELESPDSDVNALEGGRSSADGVVDATSQNGTGSAPPAPPPQKTGLKQKLRKFNIYLLMFLFIILVAGVIVATAYFQSKKAATTTTVNTQKLTQQTLEQVASSDATVGTAQSVLNVQSSAVFAGKVLVRDGLEVAGGLQIGGSVTVSDLNVSGIGQFGQLKVSKDLAVSGDSAVQGSETIGKSIQVTGGGSFGGPVTAPQITTSSLQLNSDLVLTHHISVSGGIPGHDQGPALGSGGSSTVNGTDTAGTTTINTGSSPAAGCFITVNFTTKYSRTPRVLVTPVGSSAGKIDYYVNRSANNFSICDASAPPSGASFAFDYFVID